MARNTPAPVQQYRGTTNQHANYVGREGELTVDTTKDVVVVHDGNTKGGFPMAKDSTVVHRTGNETIQGVKTFSGTVRAVTPGATPNARDVVTVEYLPTFLQNVLADGAVSPGDGINVDVSGTQAVVSVDDVWLESQVDSIVAETVNTGNLVDAGNGITVTNANGVATVAARVVSNGGLAATTSGLQLSPSNMSVANKKAMNNALAKANGGISVDASTGQTYVDFSQMPDDLMSNVVYGMVQDGGGLAVDESGQLYVDFNTMPTDKFEALLKSIRVPIWLTANKQFYVNGTTGSDTLDGGRGESASKPFKTIQACVNYVTDNYNISRYGAYINISSGTYNESLLVGNFSVTTGSLRIRKNPDDSTNPKIVYTYSDSVADKAVTIATNDGTVYWSNVDVEFILGDVPVTNRDLGVFGVTGTTTVYLYSSVFTYKSNSTENARTSYVLGAYGAGVVYIQSGMSLISDYTSGRKPICMSSSNGTLQLNNLYGDSPDYLYIDGDFSTICSVQASGLFYRAATTDPIITAGTVTGKRYSVIQGSGIDVHGGGEEFFPGDSAGTADASTFSYYV